MGISSSECRGEWERSSKRLLELDWQQFEFLSMLLNLNRPPTYISRSPLCSLHLVFACVTITTL